MALNVVLCSMLYQPMTAFHCKAELPNCANYPPLSETYLKSSDLSAKTLNDFMDRHLARQL